MKRLLLSLLIYIGLVVPLAPAANAETLDLPCGSDGATYSVQMPEGLALDGRNCSGSLVIDSKVKIIGPEAFWGTKLTSVVIPNSVTGIGTRAFHHTKLTSVVIPNSVTDIGSLAFYNTPLTSVTIGNSLTSIGSNVFAGAKITSVTIPNSVTNIGIGAFYNTLLTSITIPNSVTSIGSYAFAGTKITSITIPNSVTDIGIAAFYNTPITSVTIPSSVTNIGIGAFAETRLTSVTIPKSVKTIGYFAFADILTLTTITFPDEISVLNANIVDRDSALTKITYCGALPGFPVTPTCPPEKAAQIAADKAAADRARIKPGTKCPKLGATSISGSYKYTCIKSGKKLVWSKGIKFATPKPTPKPTPSFKPTPKPTSNLYLPPLISPPQNSVSVSVITKPPQSMQGINSQQFLWGTGMDPAFVTLGPKNGTVLSTDAYAGKNSVEIDTINDQPILAPIDARFIGFDNRNVEYHFVTKANSPDGPLLSPASDLELCFESMSSDWPGLIFCFYHLGNTPLLLGINKNPLCSNAKEPPGPLRAQGWLFYTTNDGFHPGDTISASCKSLLGREVKRGDVIAYSGTTGPHSQAPIKMKVQDKSINPTVNNGNRNYHWVQGDAFFYWKCYAPNAVFEQGVLAYPWECGGYRVPIEQRSVDFKYRE